MPSTVTSPKLAQPFCPVKSIPPFTPRGELDAMIHHKTPLLPKKIIVSYNSINKGNPYGVSRTYRVLSPQFLLKRFDNIRDCLEYTLGLTTAQREVVLRLLRLWAYYGQVYPKEAQITSEPGCSKSTFWRTLHYLNSKGLIKVVNRYVIRPHAQISNLYRFDKLLILIARYLAEHGVQFLEKWLKPYLELPGSVFWGIVVQNPVKITAPYALGPPGGDI